MQIAILGYDTEGRVSYDYFVAQGHDVTICDMNEGVEIPEGAKNVLGSAYLDDLDRFDLLVRTAGMPAKRILEKNPSVAQKITTQVNEFLTVCPTRNVIGVTGTKGKGTTSTLITRMLEAANKNVHLGGNIGIPPLSFLHELTEDSWVVLELSSFQLSDLKHSPHIAVCLMVVPEHLNWHEDMDDYVAAKSNLFAQQTADDIAIFYAENDVSKEIAGKGNAKKIPFFVEPGAQVVDEKIVIAGQEICAVDELQLLGRHNLQNVCAAVTAVWQITQDVSALREVLVYFRGLPHRLEFVRELDGVSYYNDSFAAGLHATRAAVEALPEPKVLIVGGFDRMLNLDHFGTFAVEHADTFRTLLLIGKSAERLAKTLDKTGFSNYVINTSDTIEDVVAQAKSLAQPGDIVLLSPGFASFDMFKNFEDRGIKYKEAVNAL